ncbi:probable N-acetyltransferase HLS1 [Juglans microcarpa x Juglans regia]|uniref:probable N-acetyltransferase HLS1 n=1 Tax=Juglans microcarpa x Juglans regia TaxID=2249226 RepID=UPI001B7F6BBB|nr:probable N-acetyltransferase HLS1 [Juglans microcarpa x Juglans regia]
MVDNIEKKVLIREFDEDRDIEVVGKLERICEMRSKTGVSIFTNMIAISCDPLCRIRFYPLHVILVAELLQNGELVGVVRGCIKDVGTVHGEAQVHVKMGCILGLRVSPTHRRKGIGLKLVKSVEEWLLRNGAEYTLLATEKNNTASRNLFTLKCNYLNLGSLVIFVQTIGFPAKNLSQDIKIEKLPIDQAISLYEKRLRDKEVYPTDIDTILKEKLSLGTWVCYYEKEGWNIMSKLERSTSCSGQETSASSCIKSTSSWMIFSMWNTREAYKLQVGKPHPLSTFLHATVLSHAITEKICPCLRRPMSSSSSSSDHSFQRPDVGFLFLYGLLGEGEKLGELMKSAWSFASNVGQNVKDCKVVIITELGVTDPLIKHIPQEPSMSRIHDLWYAKRLIHNEDIDHASILAKGPVGNVFVDPRDF